MKCLLSQSNFSKVNIPNNLFKKAKRHCGKEENKLFLNMSRFSEEAFRKLLQELQDKNHDLQ